MSAAKPNVTYIALFIYLLFDLISFSIILPLLPSLLDQFDQQNDSVLYAFLLKMARNCKDVLQLPDIPKWNSVIIGGILASVFSMLQFLTSPLLGALSDVYGRKKLLLFTSLGLSLSYLLWVQSQVSLHFGLFFLSRMVGGLSKANIGVATAIVSDVSGASHRTRGMALVGVAFSVAFIVGPLLGAILLASNSAKLAAQVALALSLAAVLWLMAVFSETLPLKKRTNSRMLMQSVAASWQRYVNPLGLFSFAAVEQQSEQQKRNVRQLGLCYFTFLLIFSGLEYTLTFLTHTRFHYSSMEQGKMFLYLGVVMVIVQGGVVRRVKFGREKTVALLGTLVLVPAFLLLGLSVSPTPFYLGLTLFGVSSASVVPCVTSLASLQGGASEQGSLMGVLRSLGALARAFGPLAASAVFWIYGPEFTYGLGALALVLPLATLWRVALMESP